MAKKVWKALDNLSPSDVKLKDLPRKPNGLYNLKVNEYGQLVKRAGYATYGASIGASHKIVGMHRFYRQDTSIKEFLVAWNEGIYTLSDTSPYGATLIKSSLTADSDTYFVDFLNHYYFVNGVDGVFKGTLGDEIAGTRTSDTIFTRTAGTWTVDALIGQYVFSYVDSAPTVGTWTVVADNDAGTVTITGTLHTGANRIKISTIRTVCPSPPAAKPTGVAQGSGGSLGAGDYKFGYTYVDEDGYEGNMSPVSDAVTCIASDSVVLTIVNSSDAKIASRNIYRTSVGGAIYYYDGAVADNTTTTYTSTIADSSLGTEVATNHTAPQTTSHLITKRRNKLYLAYNDYLYPSHTSDVEYFPPLWRQRTGNSQKIKGLLEQLTALPVATEDSIERLVGTDEDNFEFKNSYSTEGNVAMRSYVNCDNLIVYLGFNGINYFDGTTSGIFSKAVNKYIKENIVDAYRHLSCAVYWDNKYILCYPKTGGTYPTETVWIDLKNKTYGVYSFAFSCFSLWDKGTDGLKLKGGSNTIGQVYSVFSGLDDDGSAITAYDSPEPIDLGYPELWKQFYHFYIKVKSTTVTNTIVDADSAATQKVLNVTATTGFSAGGFIVINEGGAREETKIIDTVQSGVSLTVTTNLTYAHTATQADTVITPLRFYYTLDSGTETYKDLIMTANKTLWYKIDLGGGGQRARAIKPRPYISDKYDFTIMGYAIVYELEKPEYA